MNPLEYAWLVLKDDDSIFIEDFGDVPKSDYYNAEWWWNHPHEHINSIREDFESPEHLQSQLDKEKASQFEWPSTEIKPRKENPVSMPDPFRMQKPQMQGILDHIAEELGRRGGFMEKPKPASGDNPMFRHTRAEMLAAQKQIEDEQARRKAKREARRDESV